MEEIQLHSGNFFCNDIQFDVLYKDEVYKIQIKRNSISISKNSLLFLSDECNIFEYDEGFNYIYNNIVYWVESQQSFSLKFLKLNFGMEQVKFREIMSESNKSFLEILRDNDYDYDKASEHTIEDEYIS